MPVHRGSTPKQAAPAPVRQREEQAGGRQRLHQHQRNHQQRLQEHRDEQHQPPGARDPDARREGPGVDRQHEGGLRHGLLDRDDIRRTQSEQ